MLASCCFHCIDNGGIGSRPNHSTCLQQKFLGTTRQPPVCRGKGLFFQGPLSTPCLLQGGYGNDVFRIWYPLVVACPAVLGSWAWTFLQKLIGSSMMQWFSDSETSPLNAYHHNAVEKTAQRVGELKTCIKSHYQSAYEYDPHFTCIAVLQRLFTQIARRGVMKGT